jgi:putative endopeptidase
MHRLLPALVCSCLLAGCAAIGGRRPHSGIDRSGGDPTVRPQDDLFRHVNGTWVKTVEMPADKSYIASADAVLALETALARGQWTRVESRDPVKIYNRVEASALATLAPALDWAGWLAASGLAGKSRDVVVQQPSYLGALSAELAKTPLPVWKTYLRTRLLHAYAPYLGKDFVDARFAFAGTTLSGATEDLPRWKRGVALVEGSVGESLGKLYVDAHFPPASKARMEKMVANLLAACRESIEAIDWMGPATKQEAQAKLAAFAPKIGYPKRWIDYGTLEIRPGDLVGNVQRAREFAWSRDLAKLGKPGRPRRVVQDPADGQRLRQRARAAATRSR